MSKRDGSPHNVKTAIILAVIIVVVSIASWFYMERMELIMGKFDPEGYRNVTFTDAMITCREEAVERYEENLVSITFDSHSSRWDQRTAQYKMFYRATIKSRKKSLPARDFWINCDVSGRKGVIRDFEVLEDKDSKSEAQRQNDGGLFGWP